MRHIVGMKRGGGENELPPSTLARCEEQMPTRERSLPPPDEGQGFESPVEWVPWGREGREGPRKGPLRLRAAGEPK